MANSEETFENFASPYLFDKHMERDKIVFENFRLVAASKQEYTMTVANPNENEVDWNVLPDYMDRNSKVGTNSRRAQ